MTAAVRPPLDPTPATWTDADYAGMGWHDCRIHAVSLTGHDPLPGVRLMLDLDPSSTSSSKKRVNNSKRYT